MKGDLGRVAVLMGGPSAEREVSLKSGRAVMAALQSFGADAIAIDAGVDVLDELKRCNADRVFIALHGRWGEDGVIQGALEVIGLPYTGSGVLGSALAMDKLRTKLLWQGAGIPTPEYVLLEPDMPVDRVVSTIGLPVFVKPGREGSSIGVTKVESVSQLQGAWDTARALDEQVIAERCIVGQELTVSILNDRALPVIRLETPRTFYDYEAKYLADNTRYHCPSGLDDDLEAEIRQLALRAFQVLDCRGWGRVDLMLDAAQRPYFLEVNTVPGLTDHSLVPMAARAAGIEFPDLIRHILEPT